MRRHVLVRGMHGIGDNLHERAIVRELMRDNSVWLQTSWPQLYWDLLPDLRLRPRRSTISWMARNEQRYENLYSRRSAPSGARIVQCGYAWPVARESSVLAAMALSCRVTVGDFRLPVAPEWANNAAQMLMMLAPTKPVLIYRPLLRLHDSRSPRSAMAKLARNPDVEQYTALFAAIRQQYYVISVADLATYSLHHREEVISAPVGADVEFHHGELSLETLAALVASSALVYSYPSFMTVLAQAVMTPQVCVFGGFEGPNSFAPGVSYAPWLPITPINMCACWTFECNHDKHIDFEDAQRRLIVFSQDNLHVSSVTHSANAPELVATVG